MTILCLTLGIMAAAAVLIFVRWLKDEHMNYQNITAANDAAKPTTNNRTRFQ